MIRIDFRDRQEALRAVAHLAVAASDLLREEEYTSHAWQDALEDLLRACSLLEEALLARPRKIAVLPSECSSCPDEEDEEEEPEPPPRKLSLAQHLAEEKVLTFDPLQSDDPEIVEVFDDLIARTLWLLWKPGHIVQQDFQRECLCFAGLARQHPPANAVELRQLFSRLTPSSNFADFDLPIGRDSEHAEDWIEAAWPYLKPWVDGLHADDPRQRKRTPYRVELPDPVPIPAPDEKGGAS